jgi:LysM repeat protein
MLPRMTAAEAGAPLADTSPLQGGCPFLLSEAGGWRLDMPTRDHRCAAFSPPAPLAPEKQARLCLTDTHTSCATYLASIAARQARLGEPPSDRATRWGLARTTTVIEDPGGVRSRVLTAVLDRRRWPAIPAVILVVTLLALAISGFRGLLPTTSVGASPTTAATSFVAALTDAPTQVPPTETPPAATPIPSQTAAPPTTGPTPSAAPTSGPKPTFRVYVVKPGDTLSGIASRYHTTVSAIAQLNHISDPSQLKVGQVLLIPN